MTDLNPGPELDALVAQKVMGWRRLLTGATEFWVIERDGKYHTERPIRTWSPSTDWRAAGHVLEKLHTLHLGCTIRLPVIEGRVSASIGPETLEVSHCKTGPHAICLAALAAVETPVSG